ncbi:unnamed protein product [Camellia sinensis]
MMSSSISIPISPTSHKLFEPNNNRLLFGHSLFPKPIFFAKKRVSFTATRALLSTSKESVLKDFHERRALKIISGLQNFCRDNVASVVTAADKGGATHVDIACDPELVKLATSLTSLPQVCVSSVDPAAFPAAVEAGALMVEIGNYDSFYEMGILFYPEQLDLREYLWSKQEHYGHILNLTKETKRILPSVTLSVTVPHTLSLPDQVKLAERLEQEGVDIIQTEGGKCSNPSKAGVLGLIEKSPSMKTPFMDIEAVKNVMFAAKSSKLQILLAVPLHVSGSGKVIPILVLSYSISRVVKITATPTLASVYSISRAVKVPVMCSSGLSAVTAPMAITAGAAGVGVGSAINKLNDVVAMVAEVRSIADSLGISSGRQTVVEEKTLRQ